MIICEGKKYIKRNANHPNFHKGRQSHIPSQTIGNAKVHINLKSAKQKLQKLANKYQNINDPRGFLTDLRNALGIPDTKGVSKYGVVTIPKEDGTELTVSLRITNHQANANTYIEHDANYEYNLSIAIRRKVRRNTFIPNDNVVLDEFVYYGNNLQKVESPLSKIAEGLIEYLTIGRYEDKTGVALQNVSPQPNTNNKGKINCNRKMNKNKIRLTESQLHKVIKESVKRVLRESDYMDDGDLEPQYHAMWTYGGDLNPAGAVIYPHLGDKKSDNLASWDYFDAVRFGADKRMRTYLERSAERKTPDPYKCWLYKYMDGWNEEKQDYDTPISMMKDELDKRWEDTKNIVKYNRQADSRPLHRKGVKNGAYPFSENGDIRSLLRVQN